MRLFIAEKLELAKAIASGIDGKFDKKSENEQKFKKEK